MMSKSSRHGGGNGAALVGALLAGAVGASVVHDNDFDDAPILTDERVPSTSLATRPKNWFKTKVEKAYLESFPFDGYDINKQSVATTHGYDHFSAKDLSPLLIIMTLLGFPTRLSADKKYGWTEFFRGLIGGWTPIKRDNIGNKIWTEKHRWQIAAIPVKVIIALLKIATMPFKLLLNLVKVFTEFLPMIIRAATAELFWSNLKFSLGQLRAHYKYGVVKFFVVLGLWLLTVPATFVLYGLSLALHVVGRALTSPLKSMSVAYALGQKLEKFSTTLSYIVGVFLAICSLTVSAVLWAIAFPLMMGLVVANFPAIAQLATSISQLPGVSQVLSVFKVIFETMGTWFPPLYNYAIPLLSTLSNLIGVPVSASLALVGSAFSFTAAFVATGLSKAADVFSDWWALTGWDSKKGGPLTSIANLFPTPKPDVRLDVNFGKSNGHSHGYAGSQAGLATAHTVRPSAATRSTVVGSKVPTARPSGASNSIVLGSENAVRAAEGNAVNLEMTANGLWGNGGGVIGAPPYQPAPAFGDTIDPDPWNTGLPGPVDYWAASTLLAPPLHHGHPPIDATGGLVTHDTSIHGHSHDPTAVPMIQHH